MSRDIPTVKKATFEVRLQPQLVADTAYVLQNLGNEGIQVVDTRSIAEYTGEDTRAARGGHIPNAINVDWILALDENRDFLPVAELAELYDSADIDRSKTQITHCQTGVRGAHTYFVLRYLGHENVRLYDESWVVWGNAEDTPIATPVAATE